jgi:hypothetical protein
MCVHSRNALTLPRGSNAYGESPRLGLPMRAAYTGAACEDAVEVNLVLPDLVAHVACLTRNFADPNPWPQDRRNFFASRPLPKGPEPLLEVGTDVRCRKTGSAVVASPFSFPLMWQVSVGLVHMVMCDQPAAEKEMKGTEKIILGKLPTSPALSALRVIGYSMPQSRAG